MSAAASAVRPVFYPGAVRKQNLQKGNMMWLLCLHHRTNDYVGAIKEAYSDN